MRKFRANFAGSHITPSYSPARLMKWSLLVLPSFRCINTLIGLYVAEEHKYIVRMLPKFSDIFEKAIKIRKIFPTFLTSTIQIGRLILFDIKQNYYTTHLMLWLSSKLRIILLSKYEIGLDKVNIF